MRLPLHNLAEPALDTAAFDLLPVPVAWCDAQGRWLGCNAAFASYTGQRADAAGRLALPGELADTTAGTQAGTATPGPSLAHRLQRSADADHLPWTGHGPQGQALAARLSLRSQGRWRIVTLLPLMDGPQAAHPLPLDGLDNLDSSQPPARFGTWRHDLRSGERQWDDQLWRFWGQPPQAGAPDLGLAMAAIHPDDRAAAVARHRLSMTKPGHYADRYRVIDQAGVAHRLRSLWQVQADASGQAALVNGIVFDDTERFHLAQSASDAQSQLNLVLALADIAIWEHAPATQPAGAPARWAGRCWACHHNPMACHCRWCWTGWMLTAGSCCWRN